MTDVLKRLIHQLHLSIKSNLATCRCGRWAFTDMRKPITEEAARKNYELHKQMGKGVGDT